METSANTREQLENNQKNLEAFVCELDDLVTRGNEHGRRVRLMQVVLTYDDGEVYMHKVHPHPQDIVLITGALELAKQVAYQEFDAYTRQYVEHNKISWPPRRGLLELGFRFMTAIRQKLAEQKAEQKQAEGDDEDE
jgi:hypothetical protein